MRVSVEVGSGTKVKGSYVPSCNRVLWVLRKCCGEPDAVSQAGTEDCTAFLCLGTSHIPASPIFPGILVVKSLT